MNTIEGRIYRTGIVLLGALMLLVGMAVYWQVVRAEELAGDARVNAGRLYEEEGRVQRGQILDRNGEVLAETELLPDGNGARRYHEASTAHVIGYHSRKYGDSGMEAVADGMLSGRAGATVLGGMALDLLHLPRKGGDVRLTIDRKAQQAAAAGMGQFDGAVVAVDPRTGDILALYSSPVFNPNRIDEEWDAIRAHTSHPLINRATQALYVPGSTFKTVTLAAALEHNVVKADTKVTCPERIEVVRFPIVSRNELPGRKTQNIADAYAYSCNTVFADLGLKIGRERLAVMAEGFGITMAVPFPLETAEGRFGSQDFLAGPQGLAVTAFGQGELQVTPLHLALMAAAAGNGGLIPKPRLVDDGLQAAWRRAMSPQTARALLAMMEHAGRAGHGAPNIAIPGVRIGTKTGSAELEAGQPPHAVFIAIAPVEDPRVAVAVLKEHAGSGSLFAAPVAREVIRAVLRR